MSINSRAKGARGELEACEYLNGVLGGSWTRTGSAQRRQGAQLPDVVSDDWPDLHVEVKRGKRNLNLWSALEQAKRDSAGTGRVPVVLARRDREQWVLFAEADDLMKLWRRRMIHVMLATEAVQRGDFVAVAPRTTPAGGLLKLYPRE